MNIVINQKANKPIYEQVYEQIVSQILSGEISAHFELPSIRNVASELGISVITIKKAWDNLERDGFIYARAGIGCFVAEHTEAILLDKKFLLAEERLPAELEYYKSLGLTKAEMIALIDKLYP